MMKKLFVIILFIVSVVSGFAQDSTKYKADTVNVISVADIQKAAKFLYDNNVSAKDFDAYKRAFEFLLQFCDDKRKLK